MTTQITIPTLDTERLSLRAPRMDDLDAFAAFMMSDRAQFMGGPVENRNACVRAFGNVTCLWLLRGYSAFVAEPKGGGAPIGFFGLWYPEPWPEAEFGWSVWSGADEGQGYATEAMRRLIPWTWAHTGLSTAISVIDADNTRSRSVAERLGARVDVAATAAANLPGAPFYAADAAHVVIYRHRRAA